MPPIRIPGSLIAVALMACAACSKSSDSSEQRKTTETATHAAPGAKPGSHEDWCGEHQVPESLCTRCNSSLIPAFKATGDWCQEHGLPESQCLACNPDLKIERPPKAPESKP